MEAAAVPGVAIPLLQDDCKNTSVDMDWIWDIIHLSSEDKTYRLDLDGLRETVDSWFNDATLTTFLGEPAGDADVLAREWLIKDGKRWRPFLTVCAWHALAEDTSVIPDDILRIAIAVECFHKASLIHDDIEDADATRYGTQTLHERHGIPVALNVGDLLLGEGYGLLASCTTTPDVISKMMRIASDGHRQLCVGQGAELAWAASPEPMTAVSVLSIFRQKTSPAFSVALRLGAAYAGADTTTDNVLIAFSDALGTAYQIKDDIGDFDSGVDPDDISAQRLSVLLALAHDRPKGAANPVLQAAFRRDASLDAQAVRAAIIGEDAPDRARRLMEGYKEEAVRSLAGLESASLKGLLRRVVSKIFRVQIEGWCGEFETRNVADSAPGTEGSR
jgi:geranylgeranyl pyrophosphate synthase